MPKCACSVAVTAIVTALCFAPGCLAPPPSNPHAGGATADARASDPPWIARGRAGMVAADSALASRAGAEILASGGNAFDAAIAVSLALAVTRPESTGLGGGGFMLAYVAADHRCVALDFRETAPASATVERYAALAQSPPDGLSPSVYGAAAVAVPGLLAGHDEVLRRYATLPLTALAAPAIALAEDGFAADVTYARACADLLRHCDRRPALRRRFAPILDRFCRGGRPPAPGERIRRPDLAAALRLIAQNGADAFYRGPIGESLIKTISAAGGDMTLEDLRDYRPRWREPLRFAWREFDVVAMPPPSSGGVCLAMTLNILDGLDQRRLREPPPPGAIDAHNAHLRIEAMKHAFADRARWLGDPDGGEIPLTRLISRAYAQRLAQRISPDGIAAADAYGTATLDALPAADDRGTSHFCVADRFGNVVAWTETINDAFGSLLLAEPYGIVLNNEMDDFTTVAGRPNLFGLVQGGANRVRPGLRPLSSMSPTIVFDRVAAPGAPRPVLVLGASGGPRIISSTLHVLLGVLHDRRSLADAMSAPRPHHQWTPDRLYFDRPPPPELAAALQSRGHVLSDDRRTGIVQAIQILPGNEMIGASDPRKSARPAAAP